MLKEDHYQGYCQSILDATEMGLSGRFDDSSTAAMMGTINGSLKINHPAAIGKDKVKGVAQLAVRRVPTSPHAVARSIQNPSSSTTVLKPWSYVPMLSQPVAHFAFQLFLNCSIFSCTFEKSPYISNLSAISHPKPRAIEKSQLTGAYATLPVAYGTPQNPSR